jgi:branched-subunit amino acid ABC-type transport system permease component
MKTLSFLILGLGTGAIYAAISMALVIVHRSTGVVNIAQGAMAMFPALTFVELRDRGRLVLPLLVLPSEFDVGKQNTIVAAAIAMVLGVLLMLVCHLLVFHPIREKPAVTKVVASIGITIIIQQIAIIRFGLGLRRTRDILPSNVVTVFGRRVLADRLWLAAIVVAVAIGLSLLYRRTTFGISTLAAAESEKGAVLVGLSPPRLAIINWIISAVVTCGVGILVTPIAGVNPINYSLFVVPALAGALAGRLKSLGVATAAALAFGCFGALSVKLTGNDDVPRILRGGFDMLVPFVVIVGALVFSGSTLPKRGAIVDHRHPRSPLPTVGWGFGTITGLCLLMALFAPSGIRLALIQSLAASLLALSVVVPTGLVGQVSLAQMAFAGIGAFSLSLLADELGVPFPLSPILAVMFTTAVATLVTIPALRIRGVHLTVVTLAFGVTLEQLLFRNPALLGNDGMAVVPAPTIFGRPVGISAPPPNFPRQAFTAGLVVVTALVFVLVANLRRSATGRQLLAVRANEQAAAAAGIEVARAKIIANAVGSFVVAVGGVALAYNYVTFSSVGFEATLGLQILALTYLGGVGSIGGAAIAGCLAPAGLILHYFTGETSSATAFVLNGFGLVIVAVKYPGGLTEALAQLKAWVRRRASVPRADNGSAVVGDDEVQFVAVD